MSSSATYIEKFQRFNLDASSGAVGLGPENNLFQRELEQVMGDIIDHKKSLISRSSGADRGVGKKNYGHDSILLAGARGAGKTTFLLSVIHEIGRHNETKDDVVPLGDPLDPTLIDSDEVFLAAIVGVIHRRTLEKLGGAPRPHYDKALSKLGKAITVLSKPGTEAIIQSISTSPDLFGEHLLKEATTGIDLREIFVQYVEAALEACKAKLFVLLLDDVDMHFANGWTVLETVRRYLVDGRLLTIISGDLELYGLVVREHMWQRLYKIAEREESNTVKKQVHNLESQYLLKLLRPASRVFLPDPLLRIRELERLKDNSIRIQMGNSADSAPTLSALIQSVNRHFFGVEVTDPLALNSPAGRLLTHNTRQIRAALTWLHRWAPREDDSKERIAERIRNGLRALRDLHPQVRDTHLTNEVLDNILQDGEYGTLTLWACSHERIPELWRLNVSLLDDGPEKEPFVAATLVVIATLYARWKTHPWEMFDFLGRFAFPACVDRRQNTGSNSSAGNPHPVATMDWRLSEPGAPRETAARVSLFHRNDDIGQSSRSALSLKLHLRFRKEFRDRAIVAFSKAPAVSSGSDGKINIANGMVGWLYTLKHTDCTDQLLFPSFPTWRYMMKASTLKPLNHISGDTRLMAESLLMWYRINSRTGATTSELVEPLGGFVQLATVLKAAMSKMDDESNRDTEMEAALNASLEAPTYRIQNQRAGTTNPSALFTTDNESDDPEEEGNEGEKTSSTTTLRELMKKWAERWANQRLMPVEPRLLVDSAYHFMENTFFTLNSQPTTRWTVGSVMSMWATSWLNATLRSALVDVLSPARVPKVAHTFAHSLAEQGTFRINLELLHSSLEGEPQRNTSHAGQSGPSNIWRPGSNRAILRLWLCMADCPAIGPLLWGCVPPDAVTVAHNGDRDTLSIISKIISHQSCTDILGNSANSDRANPSYSPPTSALVNWLTEANGVQTTASWLLQGLIPADLRPPPLENPKNGASANLQQIFDLMKSMNKSDNSDTAAHFVAINPEILARFQEERSKNKGVAFDSLKKLIPYPINLKTKADLNSFMEKVEKLSSHQLQTNSAIENITKTSPVPNEQESE